MNARIHGHYLEATVATPVRPFSQAVTSADVNQESSRSSESLTNAKSYGPIPNYCDFHLTNRETEVLALIASGYSNKQAARELDISPYTVAGYIKEIYRKLHINSRAEATIVAMKLGLLDTSLLAHHYAEMGR